MESAGKPWKTNGIQWKSMVSCACRGASPRLEFGRHLLAILHSFLRLGVIFTAPRAAERGSMFIHFSMESNGFSWLFNRFSLVFHCFPWFFLPCSSILFHVHAVFEAFLFSQVLFLVFASFTSAYLVMGSRLPLRALIEKVYRGLFLADGEGLDVMEGEDAGDLQPRPG